MTFHETLLPGIFEIHLQPTPDNRMFLRAPGAKGSGTIVFDNMTGRKGERVAGRCWV